MQSFKGFWSRLPWHTKSPRIVIVDCPEFPEIAHVCMVCRPSIYAELPFAILTEMTKISKILPFVYTKSSQNLEADYSDIFNTLEGNYV
jgi:hypothetical protein